MQIFHKEGCLIVQISHKESIFLLEEIKMPIIKVQGFWILALKVDKPVNDLIPTYIKDL